MEAVKIEHIGTAIKRRQMLEALEKSLGIVSTACEDGGRMDRTTHYAMAEVGRSGIQEAR